MLLRLEPDQINRYWEALKKLVASALPPTTLEEEATSNNIYKNLLSGDMHCWVAVKGKTSYAVVVTTFQYDTVGTWSFLIYALVGVQYLNLDSWKIIFNTLSKFAKANHCKRIIAYSNVERIIRISKTFGGEAKYTFITIPVEEI